MEYFDLVRKRRSVRKFINEKVPEEVITKALKAALLAPNSSNLQPWEFYWVKDIKNKKGLIKACFSQNAAKTAQELIVAVSRIDTWKRNRDLILDNYKKKGKLIPLVENMPSASAIRPGDIIKTGKGKTIEVVNTDAEGRLILADSLEYSQKFKPTFVYITPTQIRFIFSFFITLPTTLNVFIGGGRLNSQTRQMAKQIFPNAIVHLFYGSSETSFITISDEFTPFGSVGKAFPNVEIKLEKSGAYKNRIWVKSNYLFLTYAEGSNKNSIWQDDWLTIGEYGRIDSDGYLYLLSEDINEV